MMPAAVCYECTAALLPYCCCRCLLLPTATIAGSAAIAAAPHALPPGAAPHVQARVAPHARPPPSRSARALAQTPADPLGFPPTGLERGVWLLRERT